MPEPASTAPAGRITIYTESPQTRVRMCRLCHGRPEAHDPACPVLALHAQLRELTAQLGLFVATMRETLDAVDRLLRGEAP